jgi:hypothetical protein
VKRLTRNRNADSLNAPILERFSHYKWLTPNLPTNEGLQNRRLAFVLTQSLFGGLNFTEPGQRRGCMTDNTEPTPNARREPRQTLQTAPAYSTRTARPMSRSYHESTVVCRLFIFASLTCLMMGDSNSLPRHLNRFTFANQDLATALKNSVLAARP